MLKLNLSSLSIEITLTLTFCPSFKASSVFSTLLLLISEISNKRVEKTEDALKEGQIVRVKVISMENEDKFNLSMKALL